MNPEYDFTVRSPSSSVSNRLSACLDLILVISTAICCYLYEYPYWQVYVYPNRYEKVLYDKDAAFASILLLVKESFLYGNRILLYLFLYGISKLKRFMYECFNPTHRQQVCRVRILPQGVQIEEYAVELKIQMENEQKGTGKNQYAATNTDGKKIGFKTRFLPREWIIDVIVNEHVTSHRVMSIVLFRIYPQNIIICSSSKKQFNIKDAILVAAFNPNMVDMTYKECMQMWEGIRDGLELTSYKYQ